MQLTQGGTRGGNSPLKKIYEPISRDGLDIQLFFISSMRLNIKFTIQPAGYPVGQISMLDIRLLQMIICCFDTLIVEFDIWPDIRSAGYPVWPDIQPCIFMFIFGSFEKLIKVFHWF